MHFIHFFYKTNNFSKKNRKLSLESICPTSVAFFTSLFYALRINSKHDEHMLRVKKGGKNKWGCAAEKFCDLYQIQL